MGDEAKIWVAAVVAFAVVAMTSAIVPAFDKKTPEQICAAQSSLVMNDYCKSLIKK